MQHFNNTNGGTRHFPRREQLAMPHHVVTHVVFGLVSETPVTLPLVPRIIQNDVIVAHALNMTSPSTSRLYHAYM